MVTKDEILGALSAVKELPLVKKVIALTDIKESSATPIKSGVYFEPATGTTRAALILFPNSTVDDAVRAFGRAIMANMDATKRKRTEWFMTTVNSEWADLLSLNWPDEVNFPTYEKLIEHHDQPVSKLCTLIVCNTFIKNRIPRKDSFGMSLYETPCVQEFFTGARYYPLFSLVSAYAPHFIGNFPEVLADGCNGFKSVFHTQMQKELTRFIESVLS